MASPSLHDPLPPLLRLPVELHQDIIDCLRDDGDELANLYIMRLRLTNRYFHDLIPKATQQTVFALEDTAWGHAGELYAYKHCVRLRLRSQFADVMLWKGMHHCGKDAAKCF